MRLRASQPPARIVRSSASGPIWTLPEQPTDEELARLNPALAEALFGTPRRPFSVSLEFPVFDGPDYARAVELARASADTASLDRARRCGIGRGSFRRTRCGCATLFEVVGRLDACEVLIDDRPLPYARELWLPLIWFLIS